MPRRSSKLANQMEHIVERLDAGDSQVSLARELGVTQGAISLFLSRNADAVAVARAELRRAKRPKAKAAAMPERDRTSSNGYDEGGARSQQEATLASASEAERIRLDKIKAETALLDVKRLVLEGQKVDKGKARRSMQAYARRTEAALAAIPARMKSLAPDMPAKYTEAMLTAVQEARVAAVGTS